MTTKSKRIRKHRWNKSQLIESNLYVNAYTKALQQILNDEDRLTLYMISKFFADATGEVLRSHYNVGMHLYDRGEKYISEVDQSNRPLLLFLSNIYDRSKSLYYHKVGDVEAAVELIHNTLKNNRELESMGLGFLLYDRVSQYHNYSKVHFGQEQPEKGFQMLADAIRFLMTGRATYLTDLNENYIKSLDEELNAMRFSLMVDMIFESTGHIVAIEDSEEFEEDSQLFFSHIFEGIEEMMIVNDDDKGFRDWLIAIKAFYDNDPAFAQMAGTLLQSSLWKEKASIGKNLLMQYLKRKQVI